MELSEQTFHEIHQYLSGQGTPEERAAFENRMNADQELAQEFASQRRIRNGLKANEYKKLFADIHAELQREDALPDTPQADDKLILPLAPESRSNAGARWPYLAAAASVLIAAGLAWYFISMPKNTQVASDTPDVPVVQDTIQQVEQKKTPDTTKTQAPLQHPVKPAPASVNTGAFFAAYFDPKAVIESPFANDKLGVSPSSIAQWRSDTAHVQQGIRYLAKSEAALALQEFDQVETSRFRQLKGVTSWYKALAYLQRNDLKKCKEQLQIVMDDPENVYQEKAGDLMAKIQ